MSKNQTNNPTGVIRWTGTCDCGNELIVPAPVQGTKQNNEGVRGRCTQCGGTVFCRERVDVYE